MSFWNSWVRVRHVPQQVQPGRTLTEKDLKIAVAYLSGQNGYQTFLVPRRALRAVGVRSTDELELEVVDGVIVLRPKAAPLPDEQEEPPPQ